MLRNIYGEMTRPGILTGLLIAFCVIGTVSPVSGLKVVGVVLQESGSPGDHLSFDMEVGLDQNDTPVNITADVMDWKQGLDGANNAVENYPSPYSAKDMLTVTPKSFHLEPNGTQKLAVEANIPMDAAPGGKYAMISVHRALENNQAEGPVRTEVAVNTLVLITVSEQSLQKTGEITDLTLDKDSGEQIDGSLIFNNTGNVLYKIMTEEILKDSNGKVLGNASVPSGSSVLPGAARLIKFSLQPENKAGPGTYTFNATASLEDGTVLATKSTEFEIEA